MLYLSRMEAYFVHIASRVEKLRQGEADSVGWMDELKSWPLWRAVLAEFIATMLFVFIGTMSASSMAETTDVDAKFLRVRDIACSFLYV